MLPITPELHVILLEFSLSLFCFVERPLVLFKIKYCASKSRQKVLIVPSMPQTREEALEGLHWAKWFEIRVRLDSRKFNETTWNCFSEVHHGFGFVSKNCFTASNVNTNVIFIYRVHHQHVLVKGDCFFDTCWGFWSQKFYCTWPFTESGLNRQSALVAGFTLLQSSTLFLQLSALGFTKGPFWSDHISL